MRASIVAGGDAPPVFKFREEVLDLVALTIERLVVVDAIPPHTKRILQPTTAPTQIAPSSVSRINVYEGQFLMMQIPSWKDTK